MASTPFQRQFRLRSAVAGAVAVSVAVVVVVVGFSLRSNATQESTGPAAVPGSDVPATTEPTTPASTTVTVPPAPVPVPEATVPTTGAASGGSSGGASGGYAPPVPATPDNGSVPPPPQPPAPAPAPTPGANLPGDGDPFGIPGATVVGVLNDPYGDGTAKQWLYSLPSASVQSGCDLIAGALRSSGYNIAYTSCGGANGQITFNGKGFGGVATVKAGGTQASVQLRVR